MYRYKNILISLFILALAVGCGSGSDPEPNPNPNPNPTPEALTAFKNKSDYGYYTGGTAIFTFDKTKHQLVVSGNKKSSRIQTDDQFEYLSCTVNSGTVATDQAVTLGIQTLGISAMGASSSVSATVVKVADGKAWLWAASTSTGYIIPAE